jgi:general secretion pathway protein N
MAVIGLMQPLGAIFVICSALATRAAAGPIDDRVDLRPQAEAGSPAAQTKGVTDTAGLSRAPGAPDPGAKSRGGNPLWTVPLSSLSATRDRPLFSASRRPPIVAVPVAAPVPQKQKALPPPGPERPLITLIGTIVSRKGSVAMLQGSNTDAISRLRLGEENDGWRVQGISLRSIVVERGAQSVKLDLPRPNIAPAQ